MDQSPKVYTVYRSEKYNCQMNELMFQASVKGMSERSELIPCILYKYKKQLQKIEKKVGMEYQKAYKQG